MTQSKFFKETLGKSTLTAVGLLIVLVTLAILLFLTWKGLATFTTHNTSIIDFLFGSRWDPAMEFGAENGPAGSAIFIVGSLSVSCLALLISTPFAVACAIFIVEISPRLGNKFLQPAIEIFVGIPSVVYGWVGISVLCPFLASVFNMPFGGESVLAGGIVLAVMIFPTITTVAADAIRNVPQEYTEASYGLGATRWQMITSVRIPAAKSGILTGIILGLSRAFGEALAVSMVIGGRLAFPKGLLSQTSTLTTQIASGMGSAADGTQWTDNLWSMALVLFVISFIFIALIRVIGRKKKED
ncbi:phosphate ABC transporter permease subunit PstC [Sporobacter termitidis]|uniref:phosphate ABC transporter permease subunit PstC n=1 Tax=Sporobacter termitidis TaxID=44749 RepID=UPI001FA8FC30|nr:phosphate ABC transporter permease subunit PstC [Sporobacter termitidis]